MNLMCPNCQKMLTVPDEFAGQLMKCPLCTGTFTVPGLPGAASPPTTPVPDTYTIHPDDMTLPPPPQEPVLSSREQLSSLPSTPPATSPPAPPSPVPSLSPVPTEDYR